MISYEFEMVSNASKFQEVQILLFPVNQQAILSHPSLRDDSHLFRGMEANSHR